MKVQWNIRVFVHVSDNAVPTQPLATLPDGSTPEEREAIPNHAAVTVMAPGGARSNAVLHTVNFHVISVS